MTYSCLPEAYFLLLYTVSNKSLRSLKYHLVATGDKNLKSNERKLWHFLLSGLNSTVPQALTVLNAGRLYQSCELNS